MTDETELNDLDELARRSATGDEIAYAALITATEDPLRAFVCSRAANLALAEEIVQSTYVTAFYALPRYQAGGSLIPWLMGIAHNHLRDEARRSRRFTALSADACERFAQDESADALEREPEPDVLRLRTCLERLTPRARELIRKRYWEGLPLEELATLMQQPANTLAALLYRARKSLALCLDGRPS